MMHLLKKIPNMTLYRIPYAKNSMVDALAKLTKAQVRSKGDLIRLQLQGWQILFSIDL